MMGNLRHKDMLQETKRSISHYYGTIINFGTAAESGQPAPGSAGRAPSLPEAGWGSLGLRSWQRSGSGPA